MKAAIRVGVFSFLLVCCIAAIVAAAIIQIYGNYKQYGVILDCGSTGTRIHIYSWMHRPTNDTPLVIEESFNSSCGVNNTPLNNVAVGKISNYIQGLLNCANTIVPLYARPYTPLYLKATGGMRLLSKEEQRIIMNATNVYLLNSDYDYVNGSSEVISGQMEGLFGWITVNYALGILQNPGSQPTVGSLDLGGASLQVAFEPSAPPSSDAVSVTFYGQTYNLYIYSYPMYGIDQGMIMAEVQTANVYTTNDTSACMCVLNGTSDIVDPGNCTASTCVESYCNTTSVVEFACFPYQYTTEIMLNGELYTFCGTSNSHLCGTIVQNLTRKEECDNNVDCGLAGIYQPALEGSFVAFSGFQYTTSFFNVAQNISLKQYLHVFAPFCNETWVDLLEKYFHNPNEAYLQRYCFQSWYVERLLEGLGFNETAHDQIRYLGAITAPFTNQSITLTWAMGAMVYEASLLPVGKTDRVIEAWWGVLGVTLIGMFAVLLMILLWAEYHFRDRNRENYARIENERPRRET